MFASISAEYVKPPGVVTVKAEAGIVIMFEPGPGAGK